MNGRNIKTMRRAAVLLIGAACAGGLLFLFSCRGSRAAAPDPRAEPPVAAGGRRIAVLAGGCFWGVEGVFERLNGVTDVTSGYSGGSAADADYESVSAGTTGHAESVRIEFDPGIIAYGTLLKVFFTVAHDPTELNYQGPDMGTQYRSAIFYVDEDQRRIAETYIADLRKAGVFSRDIVTEVAPLAAFFPAEDYHQDFMDKNPDYPYIVQWDRPKIVHLENAFPELVRNR